MAKVISVGQPKNDDERLVIAYLRDRLPDAYSIIHSFEIPHRGEKFEIDALLLAPHAAYVIDVKGVRGQIEVVGSRWHPEGRAPYASPLLKLRDHAKVLKGLVQDQHPGAVGIRDVYIDAVVILAKDDARLNDPDGRDRDDVVRLKDCIGFFESPSRVPDRYSTQVRALINLVQTTVLGRARPRSGSERYGNWVVDERLGTSDRYTEYRGHHAFAGPESPVRLRVYEADPYLPADERRTQAAKLANAFRALSRLPSHPNIVSAKDFVESEGHDKYVLVIEDTPGSVLQLSLGKRSAALTFDQQVALARDILSGLIHLQSNSITHRNITPDAILIGTDGTSRLTDFDFARTGDRSATLASEVHRSVPSEYLAPEVYADASKASPASDLFSAGLVLYESLTLEKPFRDVTEMIDCSAVFPQRPSLLRADLPPGIDEWLQSLCQFNAEDRPSATQALETLNDLLAPAPEDRLTRAPDEISTASFRRHLEVVNYLDLGEGFLLENQYRIEERLGEPGAFGVVYRVYDVLGDVTRALKIIIKDRESLMERLRQEYQVLLHMPPHPYVAKFINVGVISKDKSPFLVFEYVEGQDVYTLIKEHRLSADDAILMARQVAAGLAYIHAHGIWHCDIKPRNLIWTKAGARIIDFNVAVRAAGGDQRGGGTRKYLPPDFDLSEPPSSTQFVDRDCFALGVTLYEAVTGEYPWDADRPIADICRDPLLLPGCSDLSAELAAVLRKAVAPFRADRYQSAEEFLGALEGITYTRTPRHDPPSTLAMQIAAEARPNTNPFVWYLLSYYSQSQRSNSGTRGLDPLGAHLYVNTGLDRELLPAVLRGEFRLVVITGNAGDGKTAFIQTFERHAMEQGGTVETLINGRRVTISGKTFLTNHDGSQDEGDKVNDDVLLEFFSPFAGVSPSQWPQEQCRIIAINEGRLVDFLIDHASAFPHLRVLVELGLQTGESSDGVAVVNLNLRSVVAQEPKAGGPILSRLIARMTDPQFWRPCAACDIRDKCYAHHNARTFQDSTSGPEVLERLKTLYTLTHLRGRLHITLRDLKSALAYMLVGTRNCDEIHELYATGDRARILSGYYYNSWIGGLDGSADRLLTLLSEIDVGATSDAGLDRALDLLPPAWDQQFMSFANRDAYDNDLLRAEYQSLPREFTGKPSENLFYYHRRYLGMVRRRFFFERRDDGWREMIPFRTAGKMLALVQGDESPTPLLPFILRALNRAEGIYGTSDVTADLVLRVRQVEKGTIRSYRLFDCHAFEVHVQNKSGRSKFIEHMPSGLVLQYRDGGRSSAELEINLDIFEILDRLNRGYRPTVEETHGYCLSLEVFKNVLSSAPYQKILLTPDGHEFFQIVRAGDGMLTLSALETAVS